MVCGFVGLRNVYSSNETSAVTSKYGIGSFNTSSKLTWINVPLKEGTFTHFPRNPKLNNFAFEPAKKNEDILENENNQTTKNLWNTNSPNKITQPSRVITFII